MRDSCGSSGTGETPQAFKPRRLTARPAESEHLEGKSTTPHYLVNSNKVCENSLIFKHKKTESNLLTVTLIVYDGRDTYLLSVLYHPL